MDFAAMVDCTQATLSRFKTMPRYGGMVTNNDLVQHREELRRFGVPFGHATQILLDDERIAGFGPAYE